MSNVHAEYLAQRRAQQAAESEKWAAAIQRAGEVKLHPGCDNRGVYFNSPADWEFQENFVNGVTMDPRPRPVSPFW